MPSIMRNNIRYGSSIGGGNGDIVELTQVEYDALGDSVLTDNKTYYITDADDQYNASSVIFDNTDTNLNAVDVQSAIVEQNKNLEEIKNALKWKLVQTITGIDKSIDITSVIDKADEFLACVSASNADVVLTLNIPKSELKSSVRAFRAGYYQDSSKLGSTRVEATNTGMLIGNLNIDGTVYESTLTFTLYYR